MNKKNMKYLVLSASAVVMIVLVILSNINGKKDNTKESANNEEIADTAMVSESENNSLLAEETETPITEEIQLEIEKLIENYYDVSKKVDEKLIESDSTKDNSQTVKEINEKREGIESYKNIKTYVRPGLEESTYVVYTTYEMKFHSIKTLAPGMSVLYVAKDENNEYAILDRPEDNQLNEYINELTKDEEIAGLVLDVNTRLNKAMEKDKTLKSFVKSLENIADKEKESK